MHLIFFSKCLYTVFETMATFLKNVSVMYLTLVEGGNGNVTLVLTDELGSRDYRDQSTSSASKRANAHWHVMIASSCL